MIDNKFSQSDSLNEYYLEEYTLFQYEGKGTQGGGVFIYVNEVLKPNEMMGVKEGEECLVRHLRLRDFYSFKCFFFFKLIFIFCIWFLKVFLSNI